MACNTTVNAAILTGIVYSTGGATGQFSGGVMNLPRLLEDWGNGGSTTLTLNTSIVNLFNSLRATTQFKDPGTYYYAPTRQFSFDQNFMNSYKQPPGTPMLNVVLRSKWTVPPPPPPPMPVFKSRTLSAALSLSFCSLGWLVLAADPVASPFAESTPLSVEVKHEAGPGLLPANRAYVTAGTNKFAFLLPDGFRLDQSDPCRVALVSSDFACLLTLRIIGALPPGAEGPDAGACRKQVLTEHPGAKILEEFSRSAANRSGPAFDFRWSASTKLERHALAAFIPSQAGILEFRLVSSLEKFEASRAAFNSLLLTFRASDANGRLSIVPLSDRL